MDRGASWLKQYYFCSLSDSIVLEQNIQLSSCLGRILKRKRKTVVILKAMACFHSFLGSIEKAPVRSEKALQNYMTMYIIHSTSPSFKMLQMSTRQRGNFNHQSKQTSKIEQDGKPIYSASIVRTCPLYCHLLSLGLGLEHTVEKFPNSLKIFPSALDKPSELDRMSVQYHHLHTHISSCDCSPHNTSPAQNHPLPPIKNKN